MILHKLMALHRKGQTEQLYRLAARDAIRWMHAMRIQKPNTAMDVGCGHGYFGDELRKAGYPRVIYADRQNELKTEVKRPFFYIDLDASVWDWPRFDLVVCSNVLEHLKRPEYFLANVHRLINDWGFLYLSWTPWLSPFGGHEWSPWHYLGSWLGHMPGVNLFPTYIGRTLRLLKQNTNLKLHAMAPRYYTELWPLAHIPVFREFLTWNCALLLQKIP